MENPSLSEDRKSIGYVESIENPMWDSQMMNFSQNYLINDIPSYNEKILDIKEEMLRLKQFALYLKEKEFTKKLSRGFHYSLKEPCAYRDMIEAFRINAYAEDEGVKILDEKRRERDGLQEYYENLKKKIFETEVKTIRLDRLLNSTNVPRIRARSSGTPSNKFVLGYGYLYGVGYTDTIRPSTAPGFELAATEHLQRVIQEIGPVKAQKRFSKVYQEIFGSSFVKATNLKISTSDLCYCDSAIFNL